MTTTQQTATLTAVDRQIQLAFRAQVAALALRRGERISLRDVLEQLLADFAARDLDELAATWPGSSTAPSSARGATEAVRDRAISAPVLAHGDDGEDARRGPGRPRARRKAARA